MLCLFEVLTSCSQKNEQETSKNLLTNNERTHVSLHQDTTINDEARFVAGLPLLNKKSKLFALTKTHDWKEHRKNMDRIWNLYQQTSPKLMSFSQNELTDVTDQCHFAFYPFSGPDVLFVNALFPQMDTYLLVGLEAAGEPANIKHPTPATYKLYENAVSGIFNLSFFSTEDMKSKSGNDTINGVTPILQLLMVRAGRNIVSIRYKSLNNFGILTKTSKKSNMVEIKFYKKGSDRLQTLYYLSSDLSNKPFDRNSGLRNFLKRHQPESILCFTKSASYLMHNDPFSDIRTFILNNAQAIVQDDSGIPWRFLSSDNWNIRLYGSYRSPIPAYANYQQNDLKQAYEGIDLRMINFRIGFNRQSNLQVALHK